MKVVCILFSALLFAQAALVPSPPLGNVVDDLVRAALEYIRYQLQQHEPLKLPQIPVQDINDPDGNIFVTAVIKELYVSNAANFQVEHIENNLLLLWAKFGVFLPTLHVEGSYQGNGTVKGKAVQGEGALTSDVQNLNVTGFMQLEVIDGGIQIEDLTLDYTVEGLTLTLEGLTVEGMTQEQVEDLFKTYLLQYFQDNSALVCQKIARQFIIEANKIIKGMSLSQIIDWLKNFVNPTTQASLLR